MFDLVDGWVAGWSQQKWLGKQMTGLSPGMDPFVEGRLLFVAETRHRRTRHRSEQAREGLRRETERRLESTDCYQRRLKRVLELSREFQAQLDTEQSRRWLLLEEALLEHAQASCNEYFRAGEWCGQQSDKGHASSRHRQRREEELVQLVRSIARMLRG